MWDPLLCRRYRHKALAESLGKFDMIIGKDRLYNILAYDVFLLRYRNTYYCTYRRCVVCCSLLLSFCGTDEQTSTNIIS